MKNYSLSLLLAACAASVPLMGMAADTADPDIVVLMAEHTNIENNPRFLDLRPDDVSRHLYIWEGTATGETLTDNPYEGNEYMRLNINSGWFGFGLISDDPIDFSFFSRKQMVLHFALRTTATCPLFVKLESGGVPGSATINLTGLYDFPRDGKWHAIEIPISAFQAAGLSWAGNVMGKNYFTLISESSNGGQVIDIDYVYMHSGTREDGTEWEGLGLGEVSDENPTTYMIASEHQGVEGNPAFVDLRPDDVTRHLYVWENTAEDYPDSPLVAYEGGSFSCLNVTAPAGWFGFGVVSDQPVDMSAVYKQPYYLRFAIATNSLMPLFVKLEGNNGTSAIVYLSGKYSFRRDGEWHLVQIPISDFLYQGLDWNEPIKGLNYFSLVSEKATANYLLAFDAITIEAGDPQPVNDPRPEVDKSKLADYVLMAVEEGIVPEGKNVLDLRPNGVDVNLYVWENTAAENPTNEGEAYEGTQYSSLKIQSNWFGFGIMNSSPKDFTCFQYKNFNFHMAMRTTSTMPMHIQFEGVGSATYYLTEKNLPRDGEWHVIEFPADDLFAQGLVWDGNQEGQNYFSLVSTAAEQGAVIDFDAIYFYATGDKEEDNEEGSVATLSTGSNTLSYGNHTLLATGEGETTVYSISGQLVYRGRAAEINTYGWTAGMYIARQGNEALKFIVR